MKLNLNLDRSYDSLKLFRTYIGGSKKKELQLFQDTQDSEIKWFEFRRLVITQFEDIIHVRYSWMIFTKRLSYLLLTLALVLLSFKILSLICVGLAIFSYCFSKYFESKVSTDVSNYGIVMAFTDSYIQKEFGMFLPEVN
jgi:hypothetical protein